MAVTKANNKTKPETVDPLEFIETVEHPKRKADALTLIPFFKRITGWEPVMWGPSLIGFGRYHYKYESGREGDMFVTGFSPRKASLSLYIMPGYQDLKEPLSRLGKHKIGKACLYINKLDDVNMDVLEEIIRFGIASVEKTYGTYAR